MERTCLVTVGATVGFEGLTRAVLHPDFWACLRGRGYTQLRVQCGPDIAWATELLSSLEEAIPSGLDVSVFELSRNLMKEEMSRCRAIKGRCAQGLIISHAGTGTILDAWKLTLPLVVVPNTQLLDDHQTEMAQYLAQEGYAIMSTTRADLQEAVRKAELLVEENKTRWPPNHVINQQRDSPSAVSIWDIGPGEVQEEENAQMAHD